jgi:Chaperone of endosialidase
VAVGSGALSSNTIAEGNTAVGYQALFSADGSGTAYQNTAHGAFALYHNSGGSVNTAIGYQALLNNTGNGNIAVGFLAGGNLTTGFNNIDIGADGVADESSTIRIGNQGVETMCFIQGIFGVMTPNGVGVFVNSNGQLGTAPSSRRFKDAIKPMNQTSEALFALKPVCFRYKKEIDPVGISQLGLVAENVEKVNPDLVVRDKEGQPYSVRYDQVNAMLLNEFLKEHKTVQRQEATIARLEQQIEALTAGLQRVSAQLELNKAAPQTVLNNQ